MSKSELPPPVTKKSSKAKLWAELQCSDTELQNITNSWRVAKAEAEALRGKVESLEYQLGIVRAAVNAFAK